MKLNEIGPNVTIHADPTSLALISKEMKGIVNKQIKLFEIKTFPDITDVQSKVKTEYRGVPEIQSFVTAT